MRNKLQLVLIFFLLLIIGTLLFLLKAPQIASITHEITPTPTPGFAKVLSITPTPIPPLTTEQKREQLFIDTNVDRENAGLPTLVESGKLNASAQTKACDMVTKKYFTHISPDGTTPWDFIRAAGFNYVYAGENIAQGEMVYNMTELESAYMQSPEHRENILNNHYTYVGFGFCGWYEVTHFASL